MPVAGRASHPALLTFVVRAEPERHLHGRVTASVINGWLASEPPGLPANRDVTHPGQGTPIPLAQRGPAVVQKVPDVSALLVRARMDPPQCLVTHVEFIPSAWGPSEACAKSGASGRTALSGMYPTRRDPTGHRQAGVTWSTLSGQNCAPTQPVQNLRRHGVSVQRAGNSGQAALCTQPTQQKSEAPEDSCRESHASRASRGQFRAPGPSSQSVVQPAAGSVGWRLCRPTPWAMPRLDGGPPVWLQGAIRCGWAASCRGSGCLWGPGGP